MRAEAESGIFAGMFGIDGRLPQARCIRAFPTELIALHGAVV